MSASLVIFDGHLWRGHPPIEVFQEVKGNHDFLYKGFLGDDAPERQIQSWIGNQFRRQIQALEARASGAQLEWVFTKNDELAEMLLEAVEDFLADRGSSISVDVKFVPMKG